MPDLELRRWSPMQIFVGGPYCRSLWVVPSAWIRAWSLKTKLRRRSLMQIFVGGPQCLATWVVLTVDLREWSLMNDYVGGPHNA